MENAIFASNFKTFDDFGKFVENSSEQLLVNRMYLRKRLSGIKWSEQNYSITVEKVSQQKCIILEKINAIEYRHGSVTYDRLIVYLQNRIELFRELSAKQITAGFSEVQSDMYEKQKRAVKLSENTIYEILTDFNIRSERVRVYDNQVIIGFGIWQIKIGTSVTVMNEVLDLTNTECIQFVHALSALHKYDLTDLYEEIEQHARLSIQLHRFKSSQLVEVDIDTSFISEQFVTLVNTDIDIAKPMQYTLSDTLSMLVTKRTNRKYVVSIVHIQFGTVYTKTFTKVSSNIVDVIDVISTIYKTFKS